MREYCLDVANPVSETHLRNQPVAVASNIENDALSDDVRTPERVAEFRKITDGL